MQDENFSALTAIRALHDQLKQRLEEKQDFRITRLLEFVVQKEERHLKAASPVEVVDDHQSQAKGERSSALAEVSALHDQLRARLDESEDFRVFNGLQRLIETELLPTEDEPTPGEVPSARIEIARSTTKEATTSSSDEPAMVETPPVPFGDDIATKGERAATLTSMADQLMEGIQGVRAG